MDKKLLSQYLAMRKNVNAELMLMIDLSAILSALKETGDYNCFGSVFSDINSRLLNIHEAPENFLSINECILELEKSSEDQRSFT